MSSSTRRQPKTASPARPEAATAGRRTWPARAFVLAAAAAASVAHLAYRGVPDPDAFAHMRQAAMYGQRGLFDTSFPWAAFSAISRYGADLWYGFHLLLLPFSYLPGPFLQLKVAGAFLLTALLVLVWWALRRLGVRLPWLWPFVFLLASPGHLWRLQMTRPHLLSLGLSLLLVSFLIRGRVWQVALIACALAFFHLNFFWLVPLMALTVLVVTLLVERRLEWRLTLAALGGCIAGWLLRPHPISTLHLLNVQLLQLMLVKRQGLPLSFATELDPMEPGRVIANYHELLWVWVLAVVVCMWGLLRRERLRSPREARVLLWSGLLLSLLFMNMMCQLSKRSADQWILYAVVLAAAACTVVWNTARENPTRLVRTGVLALALVAATSVGRAAYRSVQMDVEHMAETPVAERSRGVGTWLKEHAPPDRLVFNANWWDFAELYYWNPNNRYIGGMDPIFQYAYDHQRYWEELHIEKADMLPSTADTPGTQGAHREDICTVLRRDFGADYVVTGPETRRELLEYFRHDPRFVVRYEEANGAVVEVKKASQK